MHDQESHRVVITSIGAICALGNGIEQITEACVQGLQGSAAVPEFEGTDLASRPACRVKDFTYDTQSADPMALQLLWAAVQQTEALELAALVSSDRSGVSLGTSQGAIRQLRALHKAMLKPERIPTVAEQEAFQSGLPGYGANQVARRLGIEGPVDTFGMACASSTMALLAGADRIRAGELDMVVAGGFEEFSPFIFTGFTVIGAASESACLPFDEGRDGTIVGEGACVLVLESEAHARARGATILAELSGGGCSDDAVHMTAPDRHGRGVVRAIEGALKESDVGAERMGYVSAHGTGTKFNDLMEIRAFEQVFEGLAPPPISSIKGAMGHTMGAAGAFDALTCILAVSRGLLVGTSGLNDVIEHDDWDFLPGPARQLDEPVQWALSTNSAMAGNNVALVFRRWEQP